MLHFVYFLEISKFTVVTTVQTWVRGLNPWSLGTKTFGGKPEKTVHLVTSRSKE